MNASVVDITGEYCNKQGIKVLEFSDSTSYLGITFRYKRPNSDSMGDQPLIVDPLDNKYIDLGQSSIDTGEFSQTFKENGAFAKEYIPPQTIISHYNGYIVNRKEIHEWINKQVRKLRIDQKSNKYSIDLKDKLKEDFKDGAKKYRLSLHCNQLVEIPSRIGQTKSRYHSSLGHKINHCFTRQNSYLQVYDSAQFGVVMAIKTIKNISISKGQEIFTHYGYSYSAGPKWYRDAFINFLNALHNCCGNTEDSRWSQLRKEVFYEANITTIANASYAVLDQVLHQYRQFKENRT